MPSNNFGMFFVTFQLNYRLYYNLKALSNLFFNELNPFIIMRKLLTLLLIISISATNLSAFSKTVAAVNTIDFSIDKGVQSTVSPNPARSSTTIRLNNNNEAFTIEVYDIIGNPVAEVNNQYTNDKTRVTFDVSDWSAGMYFYYIMQNDKRVSTGRIIVKH